MRILLDTCTFLWLTTDAQELSKHARRVFQDPENEVYLSVVSAWEIAVKHALGRLPLPQSPVEFIRAQRNCHAIDSLSLTEAAVAHLQRLPGHHRDPFDRMLVCQTIEHSLALLTPDPLIEQYPIRVIW